MHSLVSYAALLAGYNAAVSGNVPVQPITIQTSAVTSQAKPDLPSLAPQKTANDFSFNLDKERLGFQDFSFKEKGANSHIFESFNNKNLASWLEGQKLSDLQLKFDFQDRPASSFAMMKQEMDQELNRPFETKQQPTLEETITSQVSRYKPLADYFSQHPNELKRLTEIIEGAQKGQIPLSEDKDRALNLETGIAPLALEYCTKQFDAGLSLKGKPFLKINEGEGLTIGLGDLRHIGLHGITKGNIHGGEDVSMGDIFKSHSKPGVSITWNIKTRGF